MFSKAASGNFVIRSQRISSTRRTYRNSLDQFSWARQIRHLDPIGGNTKFHCVLFFGTIKLPEIVDARVLAADAVIASGIYEIGCGDESENPEHQQRRTPERDSMFPVPASVCFSAILHDSFNNAFGDWLRAIGTWQFQLFLTHVKVVAVETVRKFMKPISSFLGAPLFLASAISAAHLPSGDGLASSFKRDSYIQTNSKVIFAEDFESSRFRERWDEIRDKDGEILSLEDPNNAPLGEHCLKVTSVLGENTGGGMTKWFESSDTLFIRFYTKFHTDSDYIHHFVTLRANKSLQGKDRWSGFGGAGLKPDGDTRFSTALEPWGNWGRFPAPGQWNFYSYWHEMTASPDGIFWGNSFKPDEQPDIKQGEWICAEFMLKHNAPGKPDGEQAFWIDGKLIGHWKGINWRTSPELKANALTLESYVTDRWTKNKTNIVYFDNLVVAREYIGPSH
jgi:hypothetical protein